MVCVLREYHVDTSTKIINHTQNRIHVDPNGNFAVTSSQNFTDFIIALAQSYLVLEIHLVLNLHYP